MFLYNESNYEFHLYLKATIEIAITLDLKLSGLELLQDPK